MKTTIKKEDFNLRDLGGNDHVKFYVYIDDNGYPLTRIHYPKDASLDALSAQSPEVLLKRGFMKNHNSACFAGLPTQLGLDAASSYEKEYVLEGSNRVIYFPDYTHHIKEEHITAWIDLAKKHKLLPSYCNVNDVLTNKAFVFDTKTHNLNELFIYLCMARFLAAEPAYVKLVLQMSMDNNVDFLAALVFFSYSNIRNSNHHFLPTSRIYPPPTSISSVNRMDIGMAVALYRIIQNKGLPYDNVPIRANYYCVSGTIPKMYKKVHIVPPENLANEYLSKIIRADDDSISFLMKKMDLLTKLQK